MDRFKDRFSLDYLKGGSSSSESSPGLPRSSPFGLPSLPAAAAEQLPAPTRAAPQSTQDALLAYSRPVMDALAQSSGYMQRVFDLAREVGVRVDVLYPVVEFLTRKGFIVTTQHDTLGNDEIQLTPQGLQLVKS